MLNVLLVGAVIDVLLATPALDGLGDGPLALRLLVVLPGILTVAVGSALYLGAHLGPGPRDGLMVAISTRTGWSVGTARGALECFVLVLGVALGGPVGPGTVAFALGIGPAVQLAFRLLRQTPARVPLAAPAAAPPSRWWSGRAGSPGCAGRSRGSWSSCSRVSRSRCARRAGPRSSGGPTRWRWSCSGSSSPASCWASRAAASRPTCRACGSATSWGEKAVPWEVVREVRLDDGAPWASLELQDDDTLGLLAVQANDGASAVGAVLGLRALLRASREAHGPA